MGAAGAGIAVLQLGQAYGQAQSMEAMGKYQKAMSEINARNAEIQAQDAIKRGDEAASEYSKKVNQTVGAQRTAYASQGVDIGYGSAKEIQQETYEIGARDAQTIRNNAFLEAMGYRAQAQEISRSGRMAESSAKSEAGATLLAGGIKAAGTIQENYFAAKPAKAGANYVINNIQAPAPTSNQIKK